MMCNMDTITFFITQKQTKGLISARTTTEIKKPYEKTVMSMNTGITKHN